MYLDHRQEDNDGAKHSLCRWDTRNLLREIQGFDGHIQRGEKIVPPLRSLGPCVHCENSVRLGENGVGRGVWGRVRNLTGASGDFVITRLLQTNPLVDCIRGRNGMLVSQSIT